MYRRVLPLLLTAVLLLSGCTAGQKNMPQKMDEKEMTGQPSDMSGEGSMYTSLSSLGRRLSQHPPHHLIPFRRRMPGHPGAFGDGSVAGHIGVEFHVRPDLLLGLGELVRWSDAPCLVPQGLPLRVHLLNQHLQLRLALLPSVGVDAFRVLGAVRPGGGVAAFKQVVIDLGNTPGARLSLSSQHWLEVRGRVLLCLLRAL